MDLKEKFMKRALPIVVENGYTEEEAKIICEESWDKFDPQALEGYNPGLYLTQKHTKFVYDGIKSLVLNLRELDIANKKLLLFDHEYAYGYITLEKPFKIDNWTEFNDYKDEHQMTTDEWRENNWSFPLYAYRIKYSQLYKNPKGIITPVLKSDILEDAERYINDSGDLNIEERIIGDE